ncbi:Eukaryotic translation initiation factor 3 subunit C [Frankliniella fusca]|uniref:Eukaryotic translation initiation factor 3 subunit C n=1 Tax=Frankliniella fusca TaxID=407009 RepID=A0AAE1LUE7_9NEOP|nr:Eukaryotic translation initiation factor 3 subunit C [Frankliniella fusca]KAK3907978.1 Eukaryotic translation initiation factor 3 subunit C [Frankliniella fusca]KAK3931204.1 Eukaryotic translation initiation factor 3 subunit C [Frankliniella fusca]
MVLVCGISFEMRIVYVLCIAQLVGLSKFKLEICNDLCKLFSLLCIFCRFMTPMVCWSIL